MLIHLRTPFIPTVFINIFSYTSNTEWYLYFTYGKTLRLQLKSKFLGATDILFIRKHSSNRESVTASKVWAPRHLLLVATFQSRSTFSKDFNSSKFSPSFQSALSFSRLRLEIGQIWHRVRFSAIPKISLGVRENHLWRLLGRGR